VRFDRERPRRRGELGICVERFVPDQCEKNTKRNSSGGRKT
jgi:hypothetical protein